MSYILKKIHYDKCDYFDISIHGKNFDIYDDAIIKYIFDMDLIISILDAMIYYNYDFINNDNFNDIHKIYNHLGCIENDICNIITSDKINKINYDDIYDDDNKIIEEWNDIFYENIEFRNVIFDLLLTHKQIHFLDNEYFFKVNHIDCMSIEDIDNISDDHNSILFDWKYSYNNKYNVDKYIDIKKSLEEYIYKIKKILIKKSNTLEYLTLQNLNGFKMKKWILHTNIRHLTIDSSIQIKSLPDSLTHITFTENIKHEINTKYYPKSLTHICYDKYYNEILKPHLIPNVIHIKFGDHYNKKINKNTLPYSLKSITFGKYYNINIDEGVLPNTISYIIFENYEGRIRKNVLPKSLKYLEFSGNKKRNIDKGALPEGLIYIYM